MEDIINKWIKFWPMVIILPGIVVGCAIAALIIYSILDCLIFDSSDPFCKGKPFDTKDDVAGGMFTTLLYSLYLFAAVITLIGAGFCVKRICKKEQKEDNLQREINNLGREQNNNAHEIIEFHPLGSEVISPKEIEEVKEESVIKNLGSEVINSNC